MVVQRDVSAALYSGVQGVFYPVTLVSVDWPGGAVYGHTGQGDISYDSQTWTGAGKYAMVSIPSEEMSGVASEAEVKLAGPIATVLNDYDSEPIYRDAAVYWGITTEPGGNNLIGATPLSIGYVSDVGFNQSGGDLQSHYLSLTIGSGPSARSTGNIIHSYESQLSQHAGDTLFRHTVFASTRAANPPQW